MEKELVNEIHDFLKNYGNYADQYMLDYYIDEQWSSIPEEWQNFFESKKDNIQDVALYLLDFDNNKLDKEAPITLRKMKNDMKHVFDKLFTVDCGAGIGHLSRILAYFFKDHINIEVSTVEGNDKFVDQSIKLDQIFENKLKYMGQEIPNFKIQRISKLVSDKNSLINENDSNKNLILGLHTCGDFASTLIKHFSLNSNATALVNVGCCYHKLNNGNDMEYRQIYDNNIDSINENYNYPMSNEKNIFPNLSYAARELACHGLKQFKEKLNTKVDLLSSFKINLFRAKLEYLIFSITNNKKYRHLGLRSVSYTDTLLFEEYIEKALIFHEEIKDKINLFKNQNYENYKNMIDININDIWKIFILYVIRLSIAPMIEIVILLDRIIYLKEHGHNSYLIDLFDSSISPRCYAIVSLK
ncbi:Protein RRNAD1 [Strongyloides ratti]|uniref:Protein RRNAD1 n=1 Tax=Strongyloides ratti TaxID=34506 RepID=A0A090MSN0_STRRB|nr:Protein RRNAD1 [Strongyloides ratti]CEF61278.1 Protein RRNAD1 [Strongyloides ratti]